MKATRPNSKTPMKGLEKIHELTCRVPTILLEPGSIPAETRMSIGAASHDGVAGEGEHSDWMINIINLSE